jgi:vancomycin aglycone glucosyltransferase
VEFVALGVDARAFMTESAAAVRSGGIPFLRRILAWGEQGIENQFRVLPEAAAGMDLVLGAGTILAGASAAELHGIPYRFIAYTPAMLPSAEHAPVFFPLQTRGRRVNRALWWSARAFVALVLRRDLNRARRALGLAPVRDAIGHVLSARPVLAVDAPLAGLPVDCGLDAVQIPCLHPRGGDPLPEKLEHFLAAGPAPVFFGFGSMPDHDPRATTRELLEAIEQIGCRALISRGWAELGDDALPGHVSLVDDVSHARLFSRTAAVVHHGGAGTTHSAARAGVPQLVVPHLLDQFYFARRVHELGGRAAGAAAPQAHRCASRRTRARHARQRAARRARGGARARVCGAPFARNAPGRAARWLMSDQSARQCDASASSSSTPAASARATARAAPRRGWPPSRCPHRRRRARAASARPRPGRFTVIVSLAPDAAPTGALESGAAASQSGFATSPGRLRIW